jgi:hypothetical protein
MPKKHTQKSDVHLEDNKFPLPVYDKKDDIYNREEEIYLDEEGQLLNKLQVQKEKKLGDGLDIPGAELDDANEEIGEEDEENNYYSLGGDNHEDLEEDRS